MLIHLVMYMLQTRIITEFKNGNQMLQPVQQLLEEMEQLIYVITFHNYMSLLKFMLMMKRAYTYQINLVEQLSGQKEQKKDISMLVKNVIQEMAQVHYHGMPQILYWIDIKMYMLLIEITIELLNGQKQNHQIQLHLFQN